MRFSRRTYSALSILILAAFIVPARAADIPANSTLAYVGTYTDKTSKGIYAFALQSEGNNPSLVPIGLAAQVTSPSFLAIDAKRHLLFAVNETDKTAGQVGGGVSSFSINPQTGMLTAINQQSSMGKGPCHIVLDSAGKNAIVANYGSGNVAVFPISADGHLSAASSFIQHEGKSINPTRQEGPHAHCVALDPDNHFVFVCDLGLDKVMIYKFDSAAGKLTPNDPPYAVIRPGSGPRHMIFGPGGKFAYVNSEMASTVTVLAYDAANGSLSTLQSLSTLPENFNGNSSTAEIAIHPSGKFLYVSNRGHDSLAIFKVDPEKGTLTYIENQSTGGKTPRHFAIDPAGKFLLAENQGSGNINLFAIDADSGKLKQIGTPAQVAAPLFANFPFT